VERHSIEINQGFTKEISVENRIHDTPWKRELTVQNIQAKERMAQELREMGFETDSIARILHLKGSEEETERPDRPSPHAEGSDT
jgi:hypothetical protein